MRHDVLHSRFAPTFGFSPLVRQEREPADRIRCAYAVSFFQVLTRPVQGQIWRDVSASRTKPCRLSR